MSNENDSSTRLSLLLRIRANDRDAQAWELFVDRYGKRIFAWCRNRRLSVDDAHDVTQEVLLKLARHLGSFEYDGAGTFRGWLRRVTENALVDFQRAKGTRGLNSGAAELLAEQEARADLKQQLEEAFDLELLDLAMARVEERVTPARFRAWRMLAVDGKSAADVGRELQMKPTSIYSARHYVQSLITAEIRSLEDEAHTTAGPQNQL